MKVYHILAHTMEFAHAELRGNVEGFAHLDSLTNRFVRNLIARDRKKELEHTLVNLSESAPRDRTDLRHRDGYPLIVLKNSLRIVRDPLEFSLPLIRFVRSVDDGILHIHGISSYMYDSIAPFLMGKPSIAHHRGGHFTWRAFPVSFPKYGLLAPFTLRMPRKLFIQNKIRIERYRKYYRIPMEKMVHVPNGMDMEKFARDPRRMRAWEEKLKLGSQSRILFVGRLERGKGIADLVEAMNQVKGAKLVVAGAGGLESELKARNDPNVIFTGRINDVRDLAALYHLSDIFALPSYSEGFPNTVMEAMACGKAVVTTPTDGALDLVEDGKTGLMVEAGSAKQLAEKLQQLIQDDALRKALGQAAKQKIEREFTWERIAPRVIGEYRKLGK